MYKQITNQKFGGDWTNQKLEILYKYLSAYSKIMNRQSFNFAYIDAFAGTGYRVSRRKKSDTYPLLEEDTEELNFIKGSAVKALEVQPLFQEYIFIEKNEKNFKELSKLKDKYPILKDKIKMINRDANKYIQELCKRNWKSHRAVMFLDPFGMEIQWETIKSIAQTKAIDLWVLFPLGVGVNRLLRKDGQINEQHRDILNNLFGTTDWESRFYKTDSQTAFFENEGNNLIKKVNLDEIGRFFIKRLKTVFKEVATNPAKLYNSKNNPLFLFCFAAENRVGVKIAKDILKKF